MWCSPFNLASALFFVIRYGQFVPLTYDLAIAESPFGINYSRVCSYLTTYAVLLNHARRSGCCFRIQSVLTSCNLFRACNRSLHFIDAIRLLVDFAVTGSFKYQSSTEIHYSDSSIAFLILQTSAIYNHSRYILIPLCFLGLWAFSMDVVGKPRPPLGHPLTTAI